MEHDVWVKIQHLIRYDIEPHANMWKCTCFTKFSKWITLVSLNSITNFVIFTPDRWCSWKGNNFSHSHLFATVLLFQPLGWKIKGNQETKKMVSKKKKKNENNERRIEKKKRERENHYTIYYQFLIMRECLVPGIKFNLGQGWNGFGPTLTIYLHF